MVLRFTFRMGFAVSAAVVAAVVVPASAQPRLQVGSVIAVRNDRSGQCLDADVTTVQLLRCNGSVEQQWRLVLSGRDDYYALRNVRFGRCLDSNGGGPRARLWNCDGHVDQEWAIDLTMTQAQPLINGFGLGPVLDADGTAVRLWHFSDATNQQWYFGR